MRDHSSNLSCLNTEAQAALPAAAYARQHDRYNSSRSCINIPYEGLHKPCDQSHAHESELLTERIERRNKRPAVQDAIAYLLKFAPREAYIDDLMDGRLYMNAAGYYHGLPGEQGDPLEASLAPGACLYGYTRLPIYCMHTVRENDIVGNTVKIPIRMIREFGCADGWIGIVQYDSFARLADRHITDGGSIYAHGPISYGVPGPKLIREIFEGIPHNLVIKTPK